MLSEKNLAMLLMAKTKSSKPKLKKVETSVPTNDRVRIALADAGRDDWARFKRECVLLKRK